MNLLDSHDVPRALHSLKGDLEALKLALVLLFLQPGAPCVYYGTETGLAGGPTNSPGTGASREAFPWDRPWQRGSSGLIPEDMAALRRLASIPDPMGPSAAGAASGRRIAW